MPDIKFNCMNCGTEIEAEATLAGKIIQCPKCRHAVKAPENLMAPGMILGGYELGMLLGKGGMGEVWLSTQNSMQRKVALKILSPSLSKDPDLIARFNNEMKMVAKLDHPGIVSAYEAGHSNGLYFLATSYVDGVTLESILDSGRVFDEKDALTIAKKVAEALMYAWDKHRILHRDIKPANIMIENGGAVKLMDMGISKSLKEDASITMTGIIVGTPYYMSPEQAKADKNIGHRTDIYSLGATLYHMLTGHLPYNATSTMGILAKVISEQLVSVREINPKVSVKCELLISKMMAKDSMERQVSWQEVIDDIDSVLDDSSVGIEAEPVVARKWIDYDGKLKIAAVFIAIFAVVLVIFAISRNHRKSVESDEDMFSSVNEDVMEPADMGKAESFAKKPVPEMAPVAVEHKRQTREERRVETAKTAPPAPAATVKLEQHPAPATAETADKTAKPAIVCVATLSQRLGLSPKEIEKVIPIVKDYFRDLKQLREAKPARGFFTLAELKDKIEKIDAETHKRAAEALPKDQAAKLMQYLEDERKAAFRNYLLHPPPPLGHAQDKK